LEVRFTKLQGQHLAFISAYTQVNRRPPAEADLRGYFKVTPPSVQPDDLDSRKERAD
jgi:hypothetical protein